MINGKVEMTSAVLSSICVDLLLVEETKEEFGYNPSTLSYGSVKKILHKCDVCRESKRSVFGEFVQGLYLSHRQCAPMKRRQTCLKKYGVDHPQKYKEIKEKTIQTLVERYGVENPSQVVKFQEKKKQTWVKRYGVDHPQKSEKVKEKTRQTNCNKYGADNPRKSLKIKQKIRQTKLENGHHWTEKRAREFVEQKALGYKLLEWGGGVHKKSVFKCPNKKHKSYKAKFNSLHQGQRCPICKESKGEKEVTNILANCNIIPISQYKLEKDKGRNSLILDFYIPSFRLGIEYDGEHHFRPVQFGGMSIEKAKEEFRKTRERDKHKNELCKRLEIALLRIRCTDNVELKVEQFLRLYGCELEKKRKI